MAGEVGPILAYECFIKGDDREHKTIINAARASEARYSYYLDVHECCPDLKYIDVRSRLFGKPVSNKHFERVKMVRNTPFARIGMRIRLGNGQEGRITGAYEHRFEAVFEDGHRGNFHPNSQVTYFDDDGNVIKKYGD